MIRDSEAPMTRTLLLSLLLLAPLAHAQDKPPPVELPPQAPSDDPDEEARLAIEGALEGPLTVSFAGAPLAEVLDLIREDTGLNIVLDPAAPDVDVTVQLQGATVRRVFDEALRGQGLQLRIFCGALVVLPTGKDLGVAPRVGPGAAGEALSARRVTLNFPGTPYDEVLSFLRDITGLTIEVSPEAERHMQSLQVHLRVRELNLRQALTLMTHLHGLTWRTEGDALHLEVRPPRQRAVAPAPASMERAEGPRLATMTKEQVEQRLQTLVSFSCEEDNLYAVAITLQNQTGIVFRVEGVDKQMTTSVEMEDVSARDILDMITPTFGARWFIEDGGVVVLQAAAPCGTCGEPRGNVSPCPSCGAQ
jgi:type II secretory pathway component GspD/PulD (secretin)